MRDSTRDCEMRMLVNKGYECRAPEIRILSEFEREYKKIEENEREHDRKIRD